MKTYGLKRVEIRAENLVVGRGCQGRNAAQARRADKKLLHRRARRTSCIG